MSLRDNFPKQKQQLFDGVILRRQNKPNDGHQNRGELFAAQQLANCLLQRLDFHLRVPLLCKWQICSFIPTTTALYEFSWEEESRYLNLLSVAVRWEHPCPRESWSACNMVLRSWPLRNSFSQSINQATDWIAKTTQNKFVFLEKRQQESSNRRCSWIRKKGLFISGLKFRVKDQNTRNYWFKWKQSLRQVFQPVDTPLSWFPNRFLTSQPFTASPIIIGFIFRWKIAWELEEEEPKHGKIVPENDPFLSMWHCLAKFKLFSPRVTVNDANLVGVTSGLFRLGDWVTVFHDRQCLCLVGLWVSGWNPVCAVYFSSL